MQVFAFPAVGAATPREEETAVFDPCGVGPGEPLVLFEVAAGLGFGFAGGGLLSYVYEGKGGRSGYVL